MHVINCIFTLILKNSTDIIIRYHTGVHTHIISFDNYTDICKLCVYFSNVTSEMCIFQLSVKCSTQKLHGKCLQFTPIVLQGIILIIAPVLQVNILNQKICCFSSRMQPKDLGRLECGISCEIRAKKPTFLISTLTEVQSKCVQVLCGLVAEFKHCGIFF